MPDSQAATIPTRTPRATGNYSSLKLPENVYGSATKIGDGKASLKQPREVEGVTSIYNNYRSHRPPNPSDPPIFRLEEKRGPGHVKENPLVKVH